MVVAECPWQSCCSSCEVSSSENKKDKHGERLQSGIPGEVLEDKGVPEGNEESTQNTNPSKEAPLRTKGIIILLLLVYYTLGSCMHMCGHPVS